MRFPFPGGLVRFQSGGDHRVCRWPSAVGQAQVAQVVFQGVLALVAHLPRSCALHEAQHAPLGVGEEACRRVLLVLVGPQVVRAHQRLAGLVHQLGHLLPGGRVAEHERVRTRAEANLAGQVQVVVGDGRDALVAVLGHAPVGVVEILLLLPGALFLEVAGQGRGRAVITCRARQLVGRHLVVDCA